MKAWVLLGLFSDTTRVHGWVPCYSLMRMERNPGSLHSLCWHGWGRSHITLWDLVGVEQLLCKIFLSRLLFFWYFRKREQPFFWGFFCLYIFRFLASSVPIRAYMRQKYNTGNPPPCISKVSGWYVFFSLPFKVFCLFSIYYSGFLVIVDEKNWENHVYFIFLEAEVTSLTF